MTPKLDEKLCEKYPKIFIDRNKPMDQTAMCWGMQCGDGWYWLIDKLCGFFMKIQEQTGAEVVATQVKEKFGGLRIHYEFLGVINDNCKEMIAKHIRDAEIEASKTCEQCGNPGKLVRKDWIETLCWKCRIKDFFGHINIFK